MLCLFTLPTYSRTLQEIKDSGEIIIGSVDSKIEKPIHYEKNGKKMGIDIELMDLIAKELKLRLVRKDLVNLDERMSSLENKEVDLVISSFSVTQERMKLIDFSSPYLTTGIGILMRNEFFAKVKTFNELKKSMLRIGVKVASTAESQLKIQAPNTSLIVVPDETQIMAKLSELKIDGYANDRIFLEVLKMENPSKYYLMKGTITSDPYGIGMQSVYNNRNKRIYNYPLKTAINKIIKNNKVHISRIYKKHTGFAIESKTTKLETNKCRFVVYTVNRGDSLTKIAERKLGDVTKWRDIFEDNNIINANIINEGQKLKIRDLNGCIRSPIKKLPSNSLSNLRERLESLKELCDDGLLKEKECAKKRNTLLEEL